MGRGRKPKDQPSDDPERWVVRGKRGVMSWHPDLQPALLAWCAMTALTLEDSRQQLAGRHNQLPPDILARMLADVDATLSGVRRLGDSVMRPFRRADWLEALARLGRLPAELADQDGAGQDAEKKG